MISYKVVCGFVGQRLLPLEFHIHLTVLELIRLESFRAGIALFTCERKSLNPT